MQSQTYEVTFTGQSGATLRVEFALTGEAMCDLSETSPIGVAVPGPRCCAGSRRV
jgi:hypothetical protein